MQENTVETLEGFNGTGMHRLLQGLTHEAEIWRG